jgi:hypothetical protein
MCVSMLTFLLTAKRQKRTRPTAEIIYKNGAKLHKNARKHKPEDDLLGTIFTYIHSRRHSALNSTLLHHTVSEDAGIEPRTVATFRQRLPDALTTRLDLIHKHIFFNIVL